MSEAERSWLERWRRSAHSLWSEAGSSRRRSFAGCAQNAEHDRGALEHAHAEKTSPRSSWRCCAKSRARRGLRFVSRRDRATLRALAWRGYPDELADDEISRDGHTRDRYCAGEGWQLHTSEDVDPTLESKGDVSYAVAPLVAGRKRIGVVAMSWDYTVCAQRGRQGFRRARLVRLLLRSTGRIFESERATAETPGSVLPASLPRVGERACGSLPARGQGVAVGGWFDELPGRLGLIVGDVMGKGVQAAASMGQLRNALRAFSVERLKRRRRWPASTVGDGPRGGASTVIYAVVDPRNGVFAFRLPAIRRPSSPIPTAGSSCSRTVEAFRSERECARSTGRRWPSYRQASSFSTRTADRAARAVHRRRARTARRRLSAKRRRSPSAFSSTSSTESSRCAQTTSRSSQPASYLSHRNRSSCGSRPDRRAVRRSGRPSQLWTDGVYRSIESLVGAAWEASANAVEHAVSTADGTVLVQHLGLDDPGDRRRQRTMGPTDRQAGPWLRASDDAFADVVGRGRAGK